MIVAAATLALSLANASPTAPPSPEPAFASTRPPAARSLATADLAPWLDGYLRAGMEAAGIPGAVVVVVRDGQVVLERGYGLADIARRRPVDPRTTLFRVGSISKLFTWTAVMQLVEQGKLDLDADVNRYLNFKIPPIAGEPVTMRRLMTHTAGFEDARRGTAVEAAADLTPLSLTMRRDLPARVYAYGATPAYSNYGAALAGYIVERVSGERFEEYATRHILSPLAMRRSSFSQRLSSKLARDLALGYMPPSTSPGAFEYINWTPAGGLSATGEDMARFMVAHLNDGALKGDMGDARILSASMAHTMHETAHVVIPGLQRMMLGFVERDVNGRDVIGHDGDTVLFHSLMALYTSERVGLFVSFNSPGVSGRAMALREQLFRDFSDRYFPGTAPAPSTVPLAVALAHARLFATDYANSRSTMTGFMAIKKLLFPVRVAVNDRGDIAVNGLRTLSGAPVWFRETTPFVWTEIGGGQRLAAIVRDGSIVRFSIDLLSPNMVFDAVPAWKSPAWLLPATITAVMAIALWLASSAAMWMIRRRLGVPVRCSPKLRRLERRTRTAATLVLIATCGWVWLLTRMLDPVQSYLLDRQAGIIVALESLTTVALLALIATSGWLSTVHLRAGSRMSAIGASSIVLAAVALSYTAWTYKLLDLSPAY